MQHFVPLIPGYQVEYTRANLTTLSDGTVLDSLTLPGSPQPITFTVFSGASAINVSCSIPPLGQLPLLPSVDYTIRVAAINAFVGPFGLATLIRTQPTGNIMPQP